MKKIKSLFDFSSRLIVAVLVLIMTLIIVANVVTFFRMSKQQTDEIGSDRIIQIRDNLEMVLMEARGTINEFSYELEMKLATTEDEAEIRSFIEQKKRDYSAYNDVISETYAVSEHWTVIPDFEGESTYDPMSREWYRELMSSDDSVSISTTYLDLATGKMCFTISKKLADGKTVVAQDYYLENVQSSIEAMCSDGNGDALIVDNSGTIVGYTDESMIGQLISVALPQYESSLHIAETVETNCESFSMMINGSKRTVFCTHTSNDWYLIYNINSNKLYRATYMQLFRNTFLYVIFAISIIALYLISNHNRKKAEDALETREQFLDRISKGFQEPLKNIIQSSDYDVYSRVENPRAVMDSIKESGLRLSMMMDNLFSYNTIVNNDRSIRKDVNLERAQKRFMIAISVTILVTIVGVAIFSLNSSMTIAKNSMKNEAAYYNNLTKQWMIEEETVIETISSIVSSNPEVLDNYDNAVSFLDGIAQQYPEISVLYITNPSFVNRGVFMNNGWVPDETFNLVERSWYVNTFSSDNGLSISDPYFDAQTGLYCITISKIIYDQEGKFLGVVGADFYLDKLIDILGSTYTNNGYAFLVDGSSVIINHPHASYELQESNATFMRESEYAVLKNDNKLKILKDYDGNYRVCLMTQEEISNFSIVVAKDFLSIYGRLILGLGMLLFVLAVCLMMIVWLMSRLTTWQAKTKQELEEAVSAAVEANKSQSQFFAQMSHEIRTPINAVLGMNEMIIRESQDENILDYAQNIDSAGNTLLSIINNLLDFSKIRDGKMEVIAVPYDTAACIRKLVHMIDEKAKKKGLEFMLDVDPNLPEKLYGDDVKLTQVITNLLSNALKYTEQGSITLRMKLVSQNFETDEIVMGVEVIDTGLGIRKEDMEKLFKAFQRLDEKRNHGIEGTGLGINIVREFLILMGSELQIDSEYGKGSNFHFVITQKVMDRNPIGSVDQILKSGIKQRDGQYIFAPDARVLVTDDNDLNLKVISSLFRRSQIQVDLADSADHAIDMLKEHTYDVIFLDHMMPGKDGIEALHEIRSNNLCSIDTPIIVLTANAIAGAREEYLNEGFNDYLSKPISSDELEIMLQKYIPETKYTMKRIEAVLHNRRKEDHEEAKNIEAKKAVETTFITIEGVDVSKGLVFMQGDEEGYLSILTEFAKSSEERLKELNSAFEAKDLANYRILVHALKSNCFTMGADSVGELAKSLEFAARDGDKDFIDAHHSELMEQATTLTTHIRTVLEERGIEIGYAKEGKAGELLNALDRFDDVESLRLVEELLQEEGESEILLNVKRLIEEFDFFEALEEAKKL